jgi:hypothetical protein
MMKLLPTVAAIAYLAGAAAACDTPPASPASVGTPAIAPAHASPDPPPGRPVILEDAGRADAAAGAPLDVGGDDAGAADAGTGAMGGGADAAPAPDGAALSSAWRSTVSGADAKVATLRSQFRACYTRNIKGRPQGRVVLHATVAADGRIQSVTASDNQGVMGGVVACMVDVLKAAQLPAPGRATTLDVPISFQSP